MCHVLHVFLFRFEFFFLYQADPVGQGHRQREYLNAQPDIDAMDGGGVEGQSAERSKDVNNTTGQEYKPATHKQ